MLHLLGRRLAKGHRSYGSASFARTPYELLEEMEQELLDVAGWGYITYAKVQEMKSKTCKRCGWPIIKLPNHPALKPGLCAPCSNGVNGNDVKGKPVQEGDK